MALIWITRCRRRRESTRDGQVYLPVDWVNEHLNERFTGMRAKNCLCMHPPESIVYVRDESTQGEKGPPL